MSKYLKEGFMPGVLTESLPVGEFQRPMARISDYLLFEVGSTRCLISQRGLVTILVALDQTQEFMTTLRKEKAEMAAR